MNHTRLLVTILYIVVFEQPLLLASHKKSVASHPEARTNLVVNKTGRNLHSSR